MDYESLSLLQAIKKWPRITIYSLCLTLNVLLWGYDGAIISNVSSMPVFQEVFGERFGDKYIIPSTWLSVWSIGFPLGSMIGAAAGAWIQDRIGRRFVLALGGAISIAAIALCFAADLTANKQAAFFMGKFVEGVAVGVIICATQTFLSEVVPPRLKGPIFALFPIFTLLGQLVAAAVVLGQTNTEGKASYRIALASEWPFSACPLVLAFVLPESPAYLLQRDNIQAARKSFRRLHGEAVALAHQDLYEDMHRAVADERRTANENRATYLECFRGTNLRRTMIVIFANTLEELFGFAMIGNVSYFLQLLGMAHSTSFIILILGVVCGLFANIGSFWTLLKFGRRILTLVTLAICALFWVSMGIAGCFDGIAVAYYSCAAMIIIVVAAGLGCWPASFVIRSETSSLRLRSKTSGLGWFFGGIVRCGFGFGVPYLYNPDAGNLGAKTGFVFFGTSLLGFALTWLFVPELKGLTQTEIDRVFEAKSSSQRVHTAQWERMESGDDLPLRNADLGYRRASAAVSRDTVSIQDSEQTDVYEPHRKTSSF